ncbi:ATP-binding protein [Amycolatopsis sp. 195334CR]|uniref:ATP-binding protein n=1 Tax=Amycolatopsis sp. 195334CR TaxID=2814588 RepID=UPI001A9035D0|nr:ATP-binding protein [Amycolatopsis sp. 195334CR]MBN6033902.1 ATP-binding protein [Amycolatopsis sp. 195334CR]
MPKPDQILNARMTLTDGPESTSWARSQVRLMLDGATPESVHQTLLVVDELISDAERYREQVTEIRLGLDRQAARLRVEVDAEATDDVPLPVSPDETADGRLLLEQLPLDWGVRGEGTTRTVWAVMNLARRQGDQD